MASQLRFGQAPLHEHPGYWPTDWTNLVYPVSVFGNVTIGYGLAWACRWRLVPVLVPVLVPLLLVLLAVDVVTTGADASIVGGSIAFTGREGPSAWAMLALGVLCWLVTVTAATAVAAGAKVGRAVGAFQALALAAKRLPYLALGLIFAAGTGLIAVFVAGSAAGQMGSQMGLIVFIAALAVLALFGARLLFTIPAALFGGSAWHITRGKVLQTAGAVLLGGIVIPFLASAGVDTIPLPVVPELAKAVLLVAAVAVQAGILAHIYVDEHPAADIDGYVGAAEPGTRPRRLISLGLLVPAMVMATFIVANPYNLPRVDAGGGGPPGGAVTLAWPAGSPPIIVSAGAVRFCVNPLCTETVLRNGGPTVMHDWGVAGVGSSGTVVKASLTGGADNGGPFIHFGQCTRDGDCRSEAWIPTRASSDEPFTWPELAVSSAPDGALIFALAQSTHADDKPIADGEVEFMFIRCADVKCTEPERFRAGKIKAVMEHGPRSEQRARLRIEPDGRPVASFWIGHTIQTVTCDPATCANPRITAVDQTWARHRAVIDAWLWRLSAQCPRRSCGLRPVAATAVRLASSSAFVSWQLVAWLQLIGAGADAPRADLPTKAAASSLWRRGSFRGRLPRQR